ncbi:ferrous iron transport protein B [Hydrogenimonas sp.]|uniref:ferrous iron transport protein B n=1 Tax=Hydrogenimonas sp. TaxID=2231112 RepID=UPI00261F8232|nr:ferrous iron transport protein B [Hydrogenimonas sp.]
MMKIAFVGNPNTGKTALINAIAGSDLEVGNWPGVTVEKKEATFRYGDRTVSLVDLPGAYTLSPYSLEEKITRNVLAYDPIDGIVDVIDATNLRRNLYLTLELIDMQKPMVLALNMFDDFTKRGFELDVGRLESILGLHAVPTVASRGLGAGKVIDRIVDAVETKKLPAIQPMQHHIENEIALLTRKMETERLPYPPRLFAVKLIEGDAFALELARQHGREDLVGFAEGARTRLESHMKLPIETIITRSRYEVIDRILDEVLTKPVIDRVILSDRIDAFVLHRFFAFPTLLFTMFLLFKLTFDGSAPLVEWTAGFFENFVGKYLHLLLASYLPVWGESLIVDGVVGGVGLVLSFLPLLFFLYFFMALLEESGYMARVSFLLDRLARSFGIKGNAFVAMLMGFGCNVPAIYATRTMTSLRERVITSLMIPLMSCSARLPIYALFTALFFRDHQVMIIMSIYLLGFLAALLIAVTADRILPKTEEKPFFLELPTYRLPTLRAIWVLTWPRLKDFIIRAGTVIVAASVILWSVIHLPPGTDVHNSYLAKSAQSVTPLFRPLGFGDHWEPVAALIPGTIAKEVVIGSLGTIYGVESGHPQAVDRFDFLDDATSQLSMLGDAFIASIRNIFTWTIERENAAENSSGLQKALLNQFDGPLNAYSYMIFVLFYIPCISTMAAIKQEFGWKLMSFELLFLPLLAYGASFLFYQTALRIF